MRRERPEERSASLSLDNKFIAGMVDAGLWLEGELARRQLPRTEVSGHCLEFNRRVFSQKKAGEDPAPHAAAEEYLYETMEERRRKTVA